MLNEGGKNKGPDKGESGPPLAFTRAEPHPLGRFPQRPRATVVWGGHSPMNRASRRGSAAPPARWNRKAKPKLTRPAAAHAAPSDCAALHACLAGVLAGGHGAG